MTEWITAGEVKKYALVKWDSLNYTASVPFASETAFNTFLTGTLIPRAQGHINSHCRRDFDVDYPGGVPDAVKDVAARAAANMIQYMVMNKMGPLIRTGEFTLSIPVQSVLTKELRELLAAWVKPRRPGVHVTLYKTNEIKETWDE